MDYCSASHAEARAAFHHWSACSKPHYGPMFEHMKRTRAYFKFTLHSCRAYKDQVHSDTSVQNLRAAYGEPNQPCLKEVHKLKRGLSTPLAFTIDSASCQKNIFVLLKGHFEKILISSKSTPLREEVLKVVQSCTGPEMPFMSAEIASVIKDLKSGKASGQDNMQSEHF